MNSITQPSVDVLIVGAGIVGLTVAHEILRRRPATRIAILEKEDGLGYHASGRNSGIMHCGIFYGSDTLKAKVCSTGAARMIAFAKQEGIAYDQCGKVIVATSDEQLPTVEKLMKNARDNNIPAERIDQQRLHEIEPYAAFGPAAIYCPTTAIIDSKVVLHRLKEILAEKGAQFHFNCAFLKQVDSTTIATSQGQFQFGKLINCAGAYADRVAKAFGLADEYALIPFKGIYWKLSPQTNPHVRANIYPVPDISLPFLGVHLSRVISGDVYIGPTAIPALGRENYGILKGIDLVEALGILPHIAGMYLHNDNNFRKLAHLELAKYHKATFLESARKLMPSLEAKDLVPTPKAGIRPQLFNVKKRKLEMDYLFAKTDTSLHVLNAISPAFTSGFAFAELIVDQAGIA